VAGRSTPRLSHFTSFAEELWAEAQLYAERERHELPPDNPKSVLWNVRLLWLVGRDLPKVIAVAVTVVVAWPRPIDPPSLIDHVLIPDNPTDSPHEQRQDVRETGTTRNPKSAICIPLPQTTNKPTDTDTDTDTDTQRERERERERETDTKTQTHSHPQISPLTLLSSPPTPLGKPKHL